MPRLDFTRLFTACSSLPSTSPKLVGHLPRDGFQILNVYFGFIGAVMYIYIYSQMRPFILASFPTAKVCRSSHRGSSLSLALRLFDLSRLPFNSVVLLGWGGGGGGGALFVDVEKEFPFGYVPQITDLT